MVVFAVVVVVLAAEFYKNQDYIWNEFQSSVVDYSASRAGIS